MSTEGGSENFQRSMVYFSLLIVPSWIDQGFPRQNAQTSAPQLKVVSMQLFPVSVTLLLLFFTQVVNTILGSPLAH